jgi:hypothetical protein
MAAFSRADRRPHEAGIHNEKLLAILIPYEIRKSLLQYLSAYDVAKLDECLGHFLDPRERAKYLEPMRDLFWDMAETQSLLLAGMEFVLLGNDTSALKQRLHDTKNYLRKYSKRKLHIFLVGFFPFRGQTSDTLERLMSFGIDRAPSKIRIFTDAHHLKKMRASHDLNTIRKFIIAFGSPTMSPKGGNAGFWHKVPNIPDATVELRVYVPSYDNRVREEVTVSRREVLQLHRCVSRNSVYEIINLFKVCVGYPVKKLHWKHAEGQAKKREAIERVYFGLFRLSCHRAYAIAM